MTNTYNSNVGRHTVHVSSLPFVDICLSPTLKLYVCCYHLQLLGVYLQIMSQLQYRLAAAFEI